MLSIYRFISKSKKCLSDTPCLFNSCSASLSASLCVSLDIFTRMQPQTNIPLLNQIQLDSIRYEAAQAETPSLKV